MMGVGAAVHARAADPGRVRYGFLAAADCVCFDKRMAAGDHEDDCGVVKVGRWRRVRLKQRAGFVPRNCSGAPLERPAPHTPVLRGARVR